MSDTEYYYIPLTAEIISKTLITLANISGFTTTLVNGVTPAPSDVEAATTAWLTTWMDRFGNTATIATANTIVVNFTSLPTSASTATAVKVYQQNGKIYLIN